VRGMRRIALEIGAVIVAVIAALVILAVVL
jgi:hypothetical protein